MPGWVRPAAEDDVEAITALAETERAAQHANRASAVWRKAASSGDVIRRNLIAGFAQPQPHMLVRVHATDGGVDGYIVAALIDAEPFFAPGGQVCFVTDFVLRDPVAWPTVGAALLDEATAVGRRRGAVAAVVQHADYDGGKRALLEARGYGPAWGYRTRDMAAGPTGESASGAVRPATAGDADAVVGLVEADFAARHAHRSSAAWRKAEGSAAAYRKELADLLTQEHVLLRVHESGGAVDGFVRAMLVDGPPVWDPGGKVCFVTEFVLGDAEWPTVGAALLGAATAEAEHRGAVAALVQYEHHDAGKRAMLVDLGYGHAWGYRTRDL